MIKINPILTGTALSNSKNNFSNKANITFKGDLSRATMDILQKGNSLTRDMDSYCYVKLIARSILEENQDIFGTNYRKKFLVPVKKFMSDNGIHIKVSKIEDGLYSASLINLRDGKPIHSEKIEPPLDERKKGATENAAIFHLITSFVRKTLVMTEGANPLKDKMLENKLVRIALRIRSQLGYISSCAQEAHFTDLDKRAESIREAYTILMPELIKW